MRKLLILGAGVYGEILFELAAQLGAYGKIGFLDDFRIGSNILGTCEEFSLFADAETDMVPAFGNSIFRSFWLERLTVAGIRVPTLIHPDACVSPGARLGRGTVILSRAVVETNVTLEPGCIVGNGALVERDCVLETCVHVEPGAVIQAANRIPACRKVESGTVISDGAYPL